MSLSDTCTASLTRAQKTLSCISAAFTAVDVTSCLSPFEISSRALIMGKHTFHLHVMFCKIRCTCVDLSLATKKLETEQAVKDT